MPAELCPEQLKQTIKSDSKAEYKKPNIIAKINEPGKQNILRNIMQS